MKNCEICPFLKDNPLSVFNTKYWKINLSSDQSYLGRCYVVSRRHVGNLSKLTKSEWKDFEIIVKKLETTIRKTFKATMFNWTCLMNDAYRQKLPKPYVHWHFRPRYNHPVKFCGLIFEDPEFGYHYAREKERSLELDNKKLTKIGSEIKNNLKIN